MNHNRTPANPGRRRLAKGGLAVPVVLATVTSKNAFAALPYHCTVSGQLSNNQSPFGPNGTTANDPCTLPLNRSAVQVSLQGDPPAFASIFSINIYVKNNTLTLDTGPNAKPNPAANLFQVLALDNAGGGNQVPLLNTLKQGVVLYQNAKLRGGPNALVPLSVTDVVELTRAAYNNSSYTVVTSMGGKTYNQAAVQAYYTLLNA